MNFKDIKSIIKYYFDNRRWTYAITIPPVLTLITSFIGGDETLTRNLLWGQMVFILAYAVLIISTKCIERIYGHIKGKSMGSPWGEPR